MILNLKPNSNWPTQQRIPTLFESIQILSKESQTFLNSGDKLQNLNSPTGSIDVQQQWQTTGPRAFRSLITGDGGARRSDDQLTGGGSSCRRQSGGKLDVFVWVGRVTQVEKRKSVIRAAEDFVARQGRSHCRSTFLILSGQVENHDKEQRSSKAWESSKLQVRKAWASRKLQVRKAWASSKLQLIKQILTI
ncbi:villin 3 [Striga asiatica]|uniref:Villin 3 n=1 Tax=Striga asiatica TaxID=4170 RepID=A0A5A7REG1_STRAF|nr:villin 3 [Striga asiatica]